MTSTIRAGFGQAAIYDRIGSMGNSGPLRRIYGRRRKGAARGGLVMAATPTTTQPRPSCCCAEVRSVGALNRADLEQLAVVTGLGRYPQLAATVQAGHYRHHRDDPVLPC